MKIRCLYDKLVPIGLLAAHPKNRNKHPDEQLHRLADILDYQGWRYPIKVSKSSGFITSGHGRLEAARLLGLKEVPVNYQEYESEEQEYADLVADNAIALWAEIDLAGINADLGDLGPDFNIEHLGIKDFVLEPADKLEPGCDEDEVPEHVEPTSKLGDIYTLGKHRLMCGDSTSIDAVEKLMDGEKADMVFTDPPYGMNLDTDYSKMHSGGGSASTKNPYQKGNKYSPIIGDDEPFDPGILIGFFDYVNEIFLWGGDYYYERLPPGGTFMVWDKNNGNEGADKMIGNGFEFCWTKQKHKKEMCRIFGRGTFGHDKIKIHPTQKPVQLVEWFFERWGKGLEIIVDLFGGSGSALIACEKTNRRCFMMELDPHYCDVIVARWEKYTGKKAVIITANNNYDV